MTCFRSLLFVPGARPERFAKAIEAGADAICIDLEDATPPAAKREARDATRFFLEARNRSLPSPAIGVRINAIDGEWWEDDLAAIGRVTDFVMVPKAISPRRLARVVGRIPGVDLWPLVETASGLRHVWDIAAADGVRGILFGAFDYAADVGCEMDWEPLLYARSQIAAACAAPQIQLLDSPSGEIADLSALAALTGRAKKLGFTGRACIHPAQLEAVHAIYTPDAEAIARAERIVAAFDSGAGAAAVLDGKLIELPIARAARRLLAMRRD